MSVASVIARNMAAYPEKTAVKVNNEELSYGEVDRMAGLILAGILMRLHRNPSLDEAKASEGIRIGIYLPRDRYLVPAVWALAKGGFTYVPLDPETPSDRVGFIVKDCGISLIVSENDTEWLFGNVPNVNVLSRICLTLPKRMIARIMHVGLQTRLISYTLRGRQESRKGHRLGSPAC